MLHIIALAGLAASLLTAGLTAWRYRIGRWP